MVLDLAVASLDQGAGAPPLSAHSVLTSFLIHLRVVRVPGGRGRSQPFYPQDGSREAPPERGQQQREGQGAELVQSLRRACPAAPGHQREHQLQPATVSICSGQCCQQRPQEGAQHPGQPMDVVNPTRVLDFKPGTQDGREEPEAKWRDQTSQEPRDERPEGGDQHLPSHTHHGHSSHGGILDLSLMEQDMGRGIGSVEDISMGLGGSGASLGFKLDLNKLKKA